MLGCYFLVGKVLDDGITAIRTIDYHHDTVRSLPTQPPEVHRVRSALIFLRAMATPALKGLIALIALLILLKIVEPWLPDNGDNMSTVRRVFDMVGWSAYLSVILFALWLAPGIMNLVAAVLTWLVDPIIALGKWLRDLIFSREPNDRPRPPPPARPTPPPPTAPPPPPTPPPPGDRLLDRLRRLAADLKSATKKTTSQWLERIGSVKSGTKKTTSQWLERIGSGIEAVARAGMAALAWVVSVKGVKAGSAAVPVILLALLVHYIATLPVPPPPPFSATGGKQALRPLEGTVGKERMPPLQFSRASIDCVLRQPPAWARSEMDGLHGSIESCKFADRPSCVPSTIVVAGTASLPGLPAEEIERARIRGQNLARVLEQDLRNRCGERTRVKSYVLNLGRYSRGPLLGEEVRQREVIVLFSRGDDDASRISLALQKYASTEPQLAQYLACEFHTTAKGTARESLLGKLDCGSR